MASVSPLDKNSFANNHQVLVRHVSLELTADFDRKVLHGFVDLDCEILYSGASVDYVVLDTRNLLISSVTCTSSGTPLKFEFLERKVEQPEVYGTALKIYFQTTTTTAPVTPVLPPPPMLPTPVLPMLPTPVTSVPPAPLVPAVTSVPPVPLVPAVTTVKSVSVRIYYETTNKSEALQWLDASQTLGKEHPFLFTQCQAIHARSMLPCQDSPSVKATYKAVIKCKNPLVAVMSAIQVTPPPSQPLLPPEPAEPAEPAEPRMHESDANDFRTYIFEQRVPVASYLIALAIGALECKTIGPRSLLYAEKQCLESAAFEFAETEAFLQAAESFLPAYVWGQYNLLVLPPSFPYGGMENIPCVFVTPSLLAGDRSLANVVAHELAHSWSGNLVTNQSWEHFWLNEGFTVYLERRIIARIHSEQEAEFQSLLGRIHLHDDVQTFVNVVKEPQYSAMVPMLDNVDPDDSFSSVPYEKGFNFLYYLTGVVGGKAHFEQFLKAYFERFAYGTLTSEDMKSFFLDFFASTVPKEKLDSIEWNKWFYGHGMPHMENQFDTTLSSVVENLVNVWVKTGGAEASLVDIQGWSSNQLCYFLDSFGARTNNNVEHKVIEALNKVYNFSDRKNAEIKLRWQLLLLKSNYTPVFPQVVEFITSIGRMKFVRPLYRALAAATPGGKDLAVKTFKDHCQFYHSIARKMVSKDLGVE